MNSLRRAATRIAEQEFWLLWVYGAPLIFASNLPTWVLAVTLLMVPLLWVARRAATGVWSARTPLDVPFALLLGLGLVGVAVSTDISFSAARYLEWLGLIALFYSLVNSGTQARRQTAVWLLLAIGVGMAVGGLVGADWTNKYFSAEFYASLPRLDVSAINARGFTANIVAGAVAPLFPLVAALLWHARGRVRWLYAGIAALFLGVLLLTQSRGAALGVGAGLLVLLAGRAPRFAIALAGAVALVGVAIIVSGQVPDGLLGAGTRDIPAGRLELWSRALVMLRDFPLTGVGLGRFQPTVKTLYPLFVNSPQESQPHAHNLYLQMGVDFGVGGIIAVVWLAVAAVWMGLMNVRRAADEQARWLALGLLGGVVVFLVHGLLDAVTLSTKAAFVVWYILGLSGALFVDKDRLPKHF